MLQKTPHVPCLAPGSFLLLLLRAFVGSLTTDAPVELSGNTEVRDTNHQAGRLHIWHTRIQCSTWAFSTLVFHFAVLDAAVMML